MNEMLVSGKFLLHLLKNTMAFFAKASGAYRPERHYMRGPGPACERKRAAAGVAQQS
jgi:hypothetical protein